MLTSKITLPDSPHPVSISKNPGFRALYLARQNEFRFSRLINTIFFIYGCWLLPEKFSFYPKNNGFARVWGLQPPAPWLVRLCVLSIYREESVNKATATLVVSQGPHIMSCIITIEIYFTLTRGRSCLV